jgi:hypothetical protein
MSWDAKDADEKFKDLSARGIITHDSKILDYGKGKLIGVYDPC